MLHESCKHAAALKEHLGMLTSISLFYTYIGVGLMRRMDALRFISTALSVSLQTRELMQCK